MGDDIDDDRDSLSDLASAQNVRDTSTNYSPSWASSGTSQPPVALTSNTGGSSSPFGDLGKSIFGSVVSDVAGAVNKALGNTPSALAAKRAQAAAAPSSGPSTALILAGVAGVVVLGAVLMRRRSA